MEIQRTVATIPQVQEAAAPAASSMNESTKSANEWEVHDTLEALIASRKPTIDVTKEVKALRLKMTKHNKSLYLILGEAYRLFFVINSASESLKKKYQKDIEVLQEKFGQKKSSKIVHTAIVRLVFDVSDMERQRVSTYASVLKNAVEANVQPVGFSEWLQNVGGIDTASRLGSSAVVEPIDIDSALADLEHVDKIATLPVPGLGRLVTNITFEFKLAFCKWDSATGQLSIFKLIEDEEKVKSAFRPFAKEVSAAALRKIQGQALLDKATGKGSAMRAALGELS